MLVALEGLNLLRLDGERNYLSELERLSLDSAPGYLHCSGFGFD